MMRRVLMLICVLSLLVGGLPLAAQGTGVYYTVQRGDTLARIARSFGTNVQAIAQANGIYNVNLIYVGQSLVIPANVTPLPQPPPPQPQPPPSSGNYYTVSYGDTLARIAGYYGVTAAAIAQANGIYNANLIYPGQLLMIPPAHVVTYIQYVVQPKDQLRLIAARYNTTWQAIAQASGLYNPNLISVGQVLLIPQ